MADPAMSETIANQPGFFSWVLRALKSRRTLKTWIRCCAALAATLVLMVSNKTLAGLGQAAFFAAIVAIILPPSTALSLFLLAIITLLLGMLVGWAWGIVAMVAGLSVRNPALLANQQQKAQASLIGGIPPALQLNRFIFEGGFLDPGSTAVYGVFLFIGTFALGAVKAVTPKLALFGTFGSIVLDIMCSYGPLFPTAQYTLAKIFIIPTCCYVCIAITTLVFIFPESLNHVYLTTVGNEFINPINQILLLQSEALSHQPSNHGKWTYLTDQSHAARRTLLAGSRRLLEQIRMTDLEFSVGRLGPGDLKRLSNELKLLTFRAAALLAFQDFVNNMNIAREKGGNKSSVDSKPGLPTDRYTILQQHIRLCETKHGHDLDSLVPTLAASSLDLREACGATVQSVRTWIQDCNSGRWAAFFSQLEEVKRNEQHETLVKQLASLQTALASFRQADRVRLVEPFESFFDPDSGHQVKFDKNARAFTARSLFVCFVFAFSIDAFAERLAKLMAVIIHLDTKRQKSRLWAPSGFGKLGRKLMSRHDDDQRIVPLSMGVSNDPINFEDPDESDEEDVEDVPEDKPARRNPDALPPTTAFGRAFLKLASALRFFRSPEGIFSLRHAVVSIALWVPGVCRSSAWFYYGNRGVWALIIGQTGLAVYAGDQIAAFVIRITGTILGLLMGMAIWYIGAPGEGHGNPYGVVIATTAFTAPFLLGRLAAPPQQLFIWVMAGVTIVLVVGYSWVDTHLPVLVDVGVGVGIGWKRALLVIIGFTASFVVMLFPRPTSTRTLVRNTLAATAGEFGRILAIEVEALLAEEARAKLGIHEQVSFVEDDTDRKLSPKEHRVRKLMQKLLLVSTRLEGLVPSLTTAQFEPQVQGIWPHSKYLRLFEIQTNLLSALLLFMGAFTHLNTKWCSILVHQTPFLNPNLLSDVFSTISILSYALAGGHPLPPSLPKLRDRLVYHERLMAHTFQGSKSVPDLDSDAAPDSEGFESLADNIDGSSMGFAELTLSILRDEQLPAHSTALVALSTTFSLIDEMAIIIRDLCGETTFRGFDTLHSDYLGREEKAVGGGLSQKMRFR